MTHDYKRNGTTTLFAALNIVTGVVTSICQPRHTHAEWLKFLRMLDRETPKGLDLHVICDNYATHKHPTVRAWLSKNRRVKMQFTPHQRFVAEHGGTAVPRSDREGARRGVFTSVRDLEDAIDVYLIEHNRNPKPFIWTASAKNILAKVLRAHEALQARLAALEEEHA